MSIHEVKVVKLPKIEKHPNADNLGLVKIDGFTVVVRLQDWKEGDLAAYIEPDYVVPKQEPFLFLGDHRRIKVRRFRGIYSQGLLVPAPSGFNEGDDVLDHFGIVRYEPPMRFILGDAEPAPNILAPKYDLENWRKFPKAFSDGEEIVVTEKIHGSNARFVYHDGRMWAGSRSHWRKDTQENRSLWWRTIDQHPFIRRFCEKYPDTVLYGEIFGFQDLKYDCPADTVFFRFFDIFRDGHFYSPLAIHVLTSNVPEAEKYIVPKLYTGPYRSELIEELAEGKSTLAGHVREGCVVEPADSVRYEHFGRVKLKCVGNGYLERD